MLWSALQAALTCGVVLVVGVPIAWVLARFEFWGRSWVLRALMLPFVVPTLVAAMGVLLFWTAGWVVKGRTEISRYAYCFVWQCF